MPYIPVDRQAALANHEVLPENVGELTYQLTKTIDEFLLGRGVDHGGLRYQDLAESLGALEGCKADFIDRVVLPYEHNKRIDNGDVWSKRVIDCADPNRGMPRGA